MGDVYDRCCHLPHSWLTVESAVHRRWGWREHTKKREEFVAYMRVTTYWVVTTSERPAITVRAHRTHGILFNSWLQGQKVNNSKYIRNYLKILRELTREDMIYHGQYSGFPCNSAFLFLRLSRQFKDSLIFPNVPGFHDPWEPGPCLPPLGSHFLNCQLSSSSPWAVWQISVRWTRFQKQLPGGAACLSIIIIYNVIKTDLRYHHSWFLGHI